MDSLMLQEHVAPNGAPYAMERTGYIEPTIDSPHEESHYYYSLNTELLEIWFFDSVTGQIYAKQKAQVSGKAEVSPAEAVVGTEAPKFNAERVTINVRVIDRNNRPIDNVRQDEFKVLEDGVPQPIFSFTREEVPVMYGLAMDTSGSLRPAFEQVINAWKAIINSNKRGDGPPDTHKEMALSISPFACEHTALKLRYHDRILKLASGAAKILDAEFCVRLDLRFRRRRASAAIIRSCISVTALHASKSSV